MAKTLSEILNVVLAEYKKTGEPMVVGAGFFSVVFKAGDVTYKVTSEGEYDKMITSAPIINMLADQGVNVPRVYMVDEIMPEQRTYSVRVFMEIIQRTCREIKEPEKLNKLVADQIEFYLKSQSERNTGFDLPTRFIVQDYLKGDTCFHSEFRNYKVQYSDDPVRIEFIRNKIKRNINFFNSIPVEHYTKFIIDATKIVASGLKLDNATYKNFLYNPSTGFHFIDIDNVDSAAVYENQVMHCTIDNVTAICNMDPKYCTEDMKNNYLNINFKLLKALKDANDHLGKIKVTRRIANKLEYGDYTINLTKILDDFKKEIVNYINYSNIFCSDLKQQYINKVNKIYGEPNLPMVK